MFTPLPPDILMFVCTWQCLPNNVLASPACVHGVACIAHQVSKAHVLESIDILQELG
jgi:hypothetical protein